LFREVCGQLLDPVEQVVIVPGINVEPAVLILGYRLDNLGFEFGQEQ
jgi:hypothetical protein